MAEERLPDELLELTAGLRGAVPEEGPEQEQPAGVEAAVAVLNNVLCNYEGRNKAEIARLRAQTVDLQSYKDAMEMLSVEIQSMSQKYAQKDAEATRLAKELKQQEVPKL